MNNNNILFDIIKSSRRWLILIIAGTLFILSQFYRSSVAVITPNLIHDLKLDAWELSTVSASFFYAFALMQIPVGLFLDSIGPRITMTLLTLVAVAGALIFSMGESYYSLTIGRVFLGIGMACNFMGTLKLITIWFRPKQFATLSAIILSAGTAGNIAAATPLALMVQTLGWRNSFVTMSGVTFFIVILFFFLVNDRPGNQIISENQGASRPKVRDTLQRAKILFSQRDFWIISFSTFCRYGIFASVQALWAGPYLIQVAGLSPVTAGNIILLMSIGMIIGSPVTGHLSDIVFTSRKKVITFGLFGMSVILGILVFLPGESGKVTLSVLFFCFGLFSSSGQLMYAHIKEQVPHENAGMAMTAINFFTMGGVAVFLQGLGFLMKFLYPGTSLGFSAFKSAFIFCGICLAVICVCYTFTTETLAMKKDYR
ncbi:MFS transporter [Desulfobacula toluolica]|uniref:Major facilitator family transporter n=1 Tax=Desulfobacula toluolica (strain DSM 7467 / Tol2) TaxID=651182 RepID=K0NK91_DESTT|nr:MFS transporter [Desulfobacula toluolica]CCK80343.1 major facilitator family transporter [Desulfobacula toluolica Tol2]